MAKFRFWRAAVAAVLPRHVAALLAYHHCFRAAVAAFWQAASEEIVIRHCAAEVVPAECRHGGTGRSDHGDLAAPETSEVIMPVLRFLATGTAEKHLAPAAQTRFRN